NGLADLLQKTVTEKVIIKFVLSADDPWIFADANQLENALLNLLINARDAMPHGGGLIIATRVEQGPQDHSSRHVCV
ncbi:hybrid sensor histidine kinase/response regulator, partial [Pseudomonas syringae pv. tagetis]